MPILANHLGKYCEPVDTGVGVNARTSETAQADFAPNEWAGCEMMYSKSVWAHLARAIVIGLTVVLLLGGVVLLVVASGFRTAPSRVEGAPDPLAQALALTAVVIGFATTVLLLRVMLAVARTHQTIDLEDLVAAECAEETRREAEDAP